MEADFQNWMQELQMDAALIMDEAEDMTKSALEDVETSMEQFLQEYLQQVKEIRDNKNPKTTVHGKDSSDNTALELEEEEEDLLQDLSIDILLQLAKVEAGVTRFAATTTPPLPTNSNNLSNIKADKDEGSQEEEWTMEQQFRYQKRQTSFLKHVRRRLDKALSPLEQQQDQLSSLVDSTTMENLALAGDATSLLSTTYTPNHERALDRVLYFGHDLSTKLSTHDIFNNTRLQRDGGAEKETLPMALSTPTSSASPFFLRDDDDGDERDEMAKTVPKTKTQLGDGETIPDEENLTKLLQAMPGAKAEAAVAVAKRYQEKVKQAKQFEQWKQKMQKRYERVDPGVVEKNAISSGSNNDIPEAATIFNTTTIVTNAAAVKNIAATLPDLNNAGTNTSATTNASAVLTTPTTKGQKREATKSTTSSKLKNQSSVSKKEPSTKQNPSVWAKLGIPSRRPFPKQVPKKDEEVPSLTIDYNIAEDAAALYRSKGIQQNVPRFEDQKQPKKKPIAYWSSLVQELHTAPTIVVPREKNNTKVSSAGKVTQQE